MAEIYRLTDLEEVFDKIDPSEDLAFDTETIGKYGVIRLAQFYQRGWKEALIIERPDPLMLFINLNKISGCNIVMQYASYDISTIQAQTGSRYTPENFSDTFLLARLAFPHLDKYSLDVLIKYARGDDPYEEAGINKADMHDPAVWTKAVLTHKDYLYAAMDVYYLFDLYDKIKDQHNSLCYKLDIHSLRAALDFQCNGFPVDRDKLQEQYKKNLERIAEIGLPINARSWKQVRPYIGSDQSDALGLAKLALKGNERAGLVRETRVLLDQNSFLDKFNTEDGLIYGRFAPSARSGRFTCSGQNLQQLPRKLKGCFGYTPEDDKVLIYSDYSGLELRSIAAITGDKKLLQLLRDGIDVHSYVAEMIFGKDFQPRDRQIAKTCNFNLLYLGGWAMLQSILIKDANIWLEDEVIKSIVRKWKKLFPGIVAWQQRCIRDFKANRLGSTPFGRRYTGRRITDQCNIENSGFGAEVAKLAIHKMYPKLLEAKEDDVLFVNFVHDSYILSAPSDPAIYEPIAKHVGDCMLAAWTEASQTAPITDVPMPVKVLVGYNWGAIEYEDDYFHEYKIAA